MGFLIVGDFSSCGVTGAGVAGGRAVEVATPTTKARTCTRCWPRRSSTCVDQVTKSRAADGKVGELACGYGAGAGAVRDFAAKMGVTLEPEEATAGAGLARCQPGHRVLLVRIARCAARCNSRCRQPRRIADGQVRFVPQQAPQSLRDQVGDYGLRSIGMSVLSMTAQGADPCHPRGTSEGSEHRLLEAERAEDR